MVVSNKVYNFTKNKVMQRKFIEEEMYIASRYANYGPYTWGEVKKFIKEAGVELMDDDKLLIYYEYADCYNSTSSEDSYEIAVIRSRMETDEEYNYRLSLEERQKSYEKERRRQKYEELKKRI